MRIKTITIVNIRRIQIFLIVAIVTLARMIKFLTSINEYFAYASNIIE